MKSILLLILLSIPSLANEGTWVDPVTSVFHISQNTAAWNNKTTAVSGSPLTNIRKDASGDMLGTFSKRGKTLEIVFRGSTYAYYLERQKTHAPATFQGEVRGSTIDGKLRLYLLKGLTTRRHRPVGTPIPELKEKP